MHKRRVVHVHDMPVHDESLSCSLFKLCNRSSTHFYCTSLPEGYTFDSKNSTPLLLSSVCVSVVHLGKVRTLIWNSTCSTRPSDSSFVRIASISGHAIISFLEHKCQQKIIPLGTQMEWDFKSAVIENRYYIHWPTISG